MSRFYVDFNSPRGVPAHIVVWAHGLDQSVSKDWQSAQRNRDPVQSLSWNRHDQDLQSIVAQFNDFLVATPGYQSLDWPLVKAMLFVETGPSTREWQDRPMQSANKNDVGYGVLMSDPSKLDLIVPPYLHTPMEFGICGFDI